MKKIIVPVDFSEHSENALKTASFLAKQKDAELIVVHMLELPEALLTQSRNFSQEQAVFYMKLAEKNFNTFLDKDYLEGIKLKPIVKHYKIFSELDDLAKDENADLIVMGSHGTSGLQEIFVGSNTEKVVRHSSVPVLVTKGVSITEKFESAVFACNFNNEDIKPYLKAKELLNHIGCELHLLHVNTPNAKFKSTRERENKVSSFLNDAEGDLRNINDVVYVSDYTVEDGILEYGNVNGIDLIVMATHGRKGLSHFFSGSISEDVANHSTLPVMTFKI